MREGKIEDNEKEARSRTELLDAKARIRALERQLKQLRGRERYSEESREVLP